MKAVAKALKTPGAGKGKLASKPAIVRPRRDRVLVEFPSSLLERADQAARSLEKNRSELIRCAVEQLLDGLELKRFEAELAAAYAANAQMNRALCQEFEAVDREGF